MNLDAMVVRRARGEPLQYILGTQPFGSLDILTRPPVLIPRPETEFWTIKLSEILVPPAGRRVSLLDLCTGSGCIPLLLCRLWPSGSVRAVGLDISHEAVQLASDNALAAGIPAASDAANSGENTFTPVLGDIFASATWTSPLLQAPFDVITSNPPYISREDYGKLSLSVKDYEDPRALLGDLPDSEEQRGLSFYHRIAQLISDKRLLKPGGLLAFEVGEKQAGDVRRIVQDKAGIRDAEIWRDPWGKERVVIGRS
ncbi:S-adenosyl-L-methionine-dependent methyltransferase [Gloeophyllum trabeum ATCC 11539]|uniref:S-adenosyl-L-methionine-dependent methyltransferase n=1 Tax=Gloeophyllum trabeum (strain ATCC 11539 / FP-39264 / Madison 617) TaxID=670483 RepID=S7QD28_GLOTA|nr:S-adenosyl-L-methionine-dependent methyltransferase [Gloeophyllum trabeum ATCC 11539]EPQ57293.1 S-adenosyl-L-methionine-dependent methyltransferase [Gloeophyllum trabeum ATCC 11539]